MSDNILAVILAVIAAAGTSLVTGYLTRPKTKAEAGLAKATGEVAISGDAREWAREFAGRAQRAEERADAAEKRCDSIEDKLDVAIDYIRVLRQEIVQLDGHPPPVPAELIPPFSPH